METIEHKLGPISFSNMFSYLDEHRFYMIEQYYHQVSADQFQTPTPFRAIYRHKTKRNYTMEITFNATGQAHSYNNHPAIIMNCGISQTIYFMQRGLLHSTDTAAIVDKSGLARYYIEGTRFNSFHHWIAGLRIYGLSELDILAIHLKNA